MGKFKPNQITAIFVMLCSFLYVAYDFIAFSLWGGEATISYVFNSYAWSHPVGLFLTAFVCGGLTVHFLRWAPLERQVNDNRDEKQ
jgi:hypothetical protein